MWNVGFEPMTFSSPFSFLFWHFRFINALNLRQEAMSHRRHGLIRTWSINDRWSMRTRISFHKIKNWWRWEAWAQGAQNASPSNSSTIAYVFMISDASIHDLDESVQDFGWIYPWLRWVYSCFGCIYSWCQWPIQRFFWMDQVRSTLGCACEGIRGFFCDTYTCTIIIVLQMIGEMLHYISWYWRMSMYQSSGTYDRVSIWSKVLIKSFPMQWCFQISQFF